MSAMNNEEIIEKLKSGYREFSTTVSSLNPSRFEFAEAGKWNAGQTLDHLYRAVSTLTKAMILPKFLFRVLFGKSNRPTRSYEELVKMYQGKLETGGKASGRYLPSQVTFTNQIKTERALEKSVEALCNHLKRYSETQLDAYILPHPLLGKITIREMMYFTIYHAEHHRKIILRDIRG
jgi:hypothetical protein